MVLCSLPHGGGGHALVDFEFVAGDATTGMDHFGLYAEPPVFPPNPVPRSGS
jgi:hypothetical protein